MVTRLERIVCALVAGASATPGRNEQDDEAFARFVVRRAKAIEAALAAEDVARIGRPQEAVDSPILAEVAPPSFDATKGQTFARRPAATFVYFIQAESGPIKIGQSQDIERRLRALQAASADRLLLVGWIHDTDCQKDPLEARLHRRFAKARVAGEWFHPVPELLAFIRQEGRGGTCAG